MSRKTPAVAPRSLQWWLVKLPGAATLTPLWILDLTDNVALLTPDTVDRKAWYDRADIKFVEETTAPRNRP